MVVADQRQRRLAEVLERRALAQELGLTETPKPSPYFLPDVALERRDHDVVRRARQHRAADDDDVIAVLVRERLADLLADALEIREIEAAVLAARRADAEQRQVACREPRPPCSVVARSRPFGDAVANQLVEARARRSGCGRR